MKICCWILAPLAVGAFCIDGADARARHPRHRQPADEIAAKLAVKPTKSKPSDAAAARRAAERRPRPDLYGNVKNPAGAAPAAAGRSAAPEGSAANGAGKAGPGNVPTRGPLAGFSPTPARTVGRVSAAKVFSPPAPGAAAPAGHGAGISGTGMSRPGVATAALGGPTKAAAVVNGTGMRSKH